MARRAKGGVAGRIALAGLALLVAALVVSWAYAAFWPKTGPASRMTMVGTPARRVIRVQVLNGSGEGGIGSRVASFLRQGGFQVVEVRNADRDDYFATMVVARRGDPVSARAVAHYLGGPPVIRQAWNSDVADVTVVLGSDRSRLHLDD
ncbi:MAG: LytR family transcriptional regulator [Candidatus Eisenbacteria bacterium]|uniref:LytR family transcriptional regulator n=1 Tax=Eiseniibacteriota bacterium TaxID=2212470 RepID=A0A538UCE3_UNCEI|nr:MAG: LytR family transcriptional regulator [Candidatus Eisenbacteria bacterium]